MLRRFPWYLAILLWGLLFVWISGPLGRTGQLLSLSSSVIPLLAGGYAQRGATLRGSLAISLAVAALFAYAVFRGHGGPLPTRDDAWVSARIGMQGFLAYVAFFALWQSFLPRVGVGLALLLDSMLGFVPKTGMLFPRLHVMSLIGPKSVHFAQASSSAAALWAMVLFFGALTLWRRNSQVRLTPVSRAN